MRELDLLPLDELRPLLEADTDRGPVLTIALPMAEADRDTLGNPTRLKHQLQALQREAGERLPAGFLKPLEVLGDDYAFWQGQGPGLALVLTRERLIAGSLPYTPEPAHHLGDSLYVVPFLPLFQAAREGWVLKLSKGHVALYRLGRGRFEHVEVPDMPTSFGEAMRGREYADNLNQHPQTSRPAVDAQRVFGSGSDEEHRERRIKEFFDRVDDAVCRVINREPLPLILACLPEHFGRYTQANGYPHLEKAFIEGNPEVRSEAELADAAREILQSRREARREEVHQWIQQELGRQGRASDAAEDIALAAHFGRVEAVLVDPRQRQRISVAPSANRAKLHNGHAPADAYDLVDYIARETLRNRGEVHPVAPDALPKGQAVAALLRY